MKKQLLIISIIFLYAGCGSGQEKLKNFPLSAVKIHESPFLQNQETSMDYILSLDPDRLLAPFLIDAGIEPKAERYGNWENTGLDGHIGGHYLTALAQMYAASGEPEFLERLEYMIGELAACQEKNGNGYVSGVPGGKEMWPEIAKGNIDAGNFSLNGKWVPLYNIHKLYAGLRDAYLVAGVEQAKDMLVDLTDWFIDLTSGLSDEQIQDMLRSEHGGLNETFADVAAITGDDKYLDLARRMSHEFILQPLLEEEDKLTGLHANTQIPKVIGYQRIASLSGDEAWSEAADFFWETVVENRSVSIGGNSVREHFHPVNDFSSMVESNQGPETCNTYNMLRLSNFLFLDNPDAKYVDFYERALYNHILSSQHPTEGGYVYFTPMRPRHYRVYSTPQLCFWCCVGSGLENHGKYGELIYAHNGKDLYVNLFIPSELNWEEKGIKLTQNTEFPYEETSELQLDLDKSQRFTLHVRYPGWVKEGEFKVFVNGEAQNLNAVPSSYVALERKWKNGDKVRIETPMHTEVEYLPDGSPWVSFVHGPIVLAAATDSTDLKGLWADDSRMGHVADGELYPVDKAPALVGSENELAAHIKPIEGKPLVFSASDLIYPEKYKNVELKPFYSIHEARYMLYWPVTTQEGLEKKLAEMKEKEREMLALEARTVDEVATGEQQPETEHNFRGEQTNTGMHKGMFWRDASGWFSYELHNENQEGKTLRVTYYGLDNNRNFDILINDVLLETVRLDGSKGDEFFDVDYKIPQKALDSGEDLNVKFVAHEGSVAGGVYYVRLLK